MPTYEYACKDCGEHLEVVQSFSDDSLTTCPACQGNLRKVFSAAGIIFKGSGWHIKDYKSGSDPGLVKIGSNDNGKSDKKSDSSSGSSSGSSTKSESKSESKTESKSESKSTSKPKNESSSGSKASSGSSSKSPSSTGSSD